MKKSVEKLISTDFFYFTEVSQVCPLQPVHKPHAKLQYLLLNFDKKKS